VLERLRLVANDLCFVRGDRLVLPLVREETDERAPDDREQTVRCTGAVRTALAAAREPIRHADLIDRMSEAYRDVAQDTIRRMVSELVEREFLLTDLRPPATTDDPVRHVLDRLPQDAGRVKEAGVHGDAALPQEAGLSQETGLAEVRDALATYARTSPGEGREAWRTATAVMRGLSESDRMIQVDLRMDADVVLPHEVAAEFEDAATLAWRLLPPHLAPADPLAEYRAAFIERYGTGALVPVKDVLDPQTGIGPPTGYLLPPGHRRCADRSAATPEHDTLLLGLAQRGDREVVLDDELVERLAWPGSGDEPASYAEMCAQLLADSEDAVQAGEFRLVAAAMNFTRPGAMFGRFLRLLPELGEAVAGVAGEEASPAAPAQLIGPLVDSRSSNVAQVPRLTDDAVQVGVFAERPETLSLDDF
jgi:hypothetical protein